MKRVQTKPVKEKMVPAVAALAEPVSRDLFGAAPFLSQSELSTGHAAPEKSVPGPPEEPPEAEWVQFDSVEVEEDPSMMLEDFHVQVKKVPTIWVRHEEEALAGCSDAEHFGEGK